MCIFYRSFFSAVVVLSCVVSSFVMQSVLLENVLALVCIQITIRALLSCIFIQPGFCLALSLCLVAYAYVCIVNVLICLGDFYYCLSFSCSISFDFVTYTLHYFSLSVNVYWKNSTTGINVMHGVIDFAMEIDT